jgi:hypothetical protein
MTDEPGPPDEGADDRDAADIGPTIPWVKAFVLVGRLKYGSELVQLSERERFLLDEYRPKRSPPSSILPGRVTYIDNLGFGLSSSIRDEICRAQVRNAQKDGSQAGWMTTGSAIRTSTGRASKPSCPYDLASRGLKPISRNSQKLALKIISPIQQRKP